MPALAEYPKSRFEAPYASCPIRAAWSPCSTCIMLIGWERSWAREEGTEATAAKVVTVEGHILEIVGKSVMLNGQAGK